MTRTLSAENYAALQGRRLVARDFLWFQVKDPTTNAPVFDGYWSDVGMITVDVVDPETGGTTSREYFGSGNLIQISDIPIVSNLVVQNVTITLSQVADRVNELVRSYQCKQGRVEIHRGLFDPQTRQLVSPAPPRFVGYIDTIDIQTPKEGSDGGVAITCTSHTQELTRANSDTRSDASQRLRNANDNFYQDTAVVGTWQLFWGTAHGSVLPVPGQAGGLNFLNQIRNSLGV
jgi:hypothetical protein